MKVVLGKVCKDYVISFMPYLLTREKSCLSGRFLVFLPFKRGSLEGVENLVGLTIDYRSIFLNSQLHYHFQVHSLHLPAEVI